MFISRGTLKLGLSGLALIGAGAALGYAGYVITNRRAEAKYDAIAQDEIAKAKEFYKALNKKEEYDDPTNLLKAYGSDPDEEIDEDLITAQAKKNKKNKKPYLILQNEFAKSRYDYDQITLTYYEIDDVLADEHDIVQDDTDGLVGNDNLLHWGYGSTDNELIYVRNDKLAVDFEIARSNKGSYAKDVLGFVEHSEPRGRPRKFRRDYE